MALIRVTKEFRFEMAHALWNYDGPCRNVHGHSYILYVTVAGEPVNFGDLKKIVNESIVDRFDHTLMVSGLAPAATIETFRKHFGNVIISSYQPTCENLVADIAATLGSRMPEGTYLHSIRLFETATSCAEWHASDNR